MRQSIDYGLPGYRSIYDNIDPYGVGYIAPEEELVRREMMAGIGSKVLFE